MSVKKIFSAYVLFASCILNYTGSKSQIINKIVHYKFEDPYFMGEGLSKFLYTKVNLKNKDFSTGVTGYSVITFMLTKDNAIKNMKVIDSTTNENFNKQVYDAIADHPKTWQVAKLNGKPVDINIKVSAKLSAIVNPAQMNSRDPHIYNRVSDVYNIIGDFEYLIDNLLANDFYSEGVAYSSANDFKEAIKYFDEVIGFSSQDIDALYSRGICKFKSDDKAGACEDWKKIQSMGKEDANGLISKYCDK